LVASIVFVVLAGGDYIAPTMNDRVQFLNSAAYAQLGLPFSEIVRAGDTLYLSGQIGNLPGTLTLADGGVQGQARQAMQNIRASLEAHGYSLGHIVKCTVMLADMADWPAFNEVYVGFFAPPYPARSALAAAGLALGGRLEIDVIAHVR
jgi:reactive intermediate/imine deaminase